MSLLTLIVGCTSQSTDDIRTTTTSPESINDDNLGYPNANDNNDGHIGNRHRDSGFDNTPIAQFQG